MDKFIIYPKNNEEKKAIQAFLETQKIKFEHSQEKEAQRLYDADFIDSMEQSFKTVMEGKISMRKFDDLKI
jgi:hypothetical protein